MKIYTYYEDIYEKRFGINDHTRLLEIWKESWTQQGWECVVLSKKDAMLNPRYNEYLQVLSKFPTTNHVDYELACFLRWVAMEHIGGGYHCDYDVMNYGYKGENENGLTFYSKWMVPCMVYGRKEDYSRMLDVFMSYNSYGKEHVSDQSILVENVDIFPYAKRYICPEYKQEGNWYNYELVHYPNARMDAYGIQPRWKYVREFNDIIRNLKS